VSKIINHDILIISILSPSRGLWPTEWQRGQPRFHVNISWSLHFFKLITYFLPVLLANAGITYVVHYSIIDGDAEIIIGLRIRSERNAVV